MQTLPEANILRLNLLTFSKLSLSMFVFVFVFVHNSDVLENLFPSISVNSSSSLNLPLWLYLDTQQYVLLLHAIISFFRLLLASLPPSLLHFHLYLILQLLHPLPQQGVLSLCVSQPLLDVLVGRDQGEVGSDGFIAGAHRHGTLAGGGVGRLVFKDADVIIHCQGLHACTGLLCSRQKTWGGHGGRGSFSKG